MYNSRLWTRDSVHRLKRDFDVKYLKQQAKAVNDWNVVKWCDEVIAETISKESERKLLNESRRVRQHLKAAIKAAKLENGLVPEERDIAEHLRNVESGLTLVSEFRRTYWTRKS